MAARGKKSKAAAAMANGGTAKGYAHPEAEAVMRPEIGDASAVQKSKVYRLKVP